MEMIDVLKKLQEIAETKPELVKDAVENVERTNPKEVEENAVESEAPTNKEPVKEYEDKIQEYQVGSYKDFLASKGVDMYKLSGDDHSKWSQEYKMAKDQSADAEFAKQGTADHKTYVPSASDAEKDHRELSRIAKYDDVDPNATEGGMSDVHIGAEEVVGEYVDEDGNLIRPKAQVLQAMKAEAEKATFPKSYEIETAMKMVADDFDDSGSRRHGIDEPEGIDDFGGQEATEPVQEDDLQDIAIMDMEAELGKINDEITFLKIDEKDKESALAALGALRNVLDKYQPKQSEATLNTNTMTTEGKKQVNEDIKMTADTPEEAGMLMQIMKLAGVQQVTPDMLGGQEPEAEPEANPEHGDEGHDHSDCPVCGDDAVGSEDMGKMRDLITAPDQEKNEETFANSVGEKDLPKTSDVDTLVNVHSGGLNRQKQQVRKEYPGDNPLAVKEDTITEADLADSFRAQYEGFKKSYQEAAKVTEKKAKPDFLDMDKDGDKKEPMKKAIQDKK
jgi:hypothetical protein